MLRPSTRATLALALALVCASVGADAAAADPVSVNPFGDANAELVAVSATGDANAGVVAASGTGDAGSPCTAIESVWVCVAASGVGDAASLGLAVSGLGDARTCAFHINGILCYGAISGAGRSYGGTVAASVLGDAQAGGAATISGTGDASACEDFDDRNVCGSLIVISGTGNATSCEPRHSSCFSFVVVSGAGNADSRCEAPPGGFCSATNAPLTASLLGDASCGGGKGTGGNCAAITPFGNADCEANPDTDPPGECTAISGTGHASGDTAISGCDMLAAEGRPEACVDPV